MIVNAQGKPYSKRDGDAYVGDFRTKGYLAEALINYLTLLGWSPGDDREKMTRDELVQAFTLDRVRSAPSQMDLVKLENLNGQYLAELPAADFVELARARAAAEPWFSAAEPAFFEQVALLMQSRTKLLTGVADWSYFFTDNFDYDDKAVRKNLRKDGVAEALTVAADKLSGVDFGDLEAIEVAIHAATDACDIRQGKLNLPLRIAITGTPVGAGLYEILSLLGKERSLARLRYAAETLCRQA